MEVIKKHVQILVVEDQVIVARDIAQQIKDLGYQVSGIAHRAERAIEMIAENAPDLVLMDIEFGGGMDGIEAAEEIRTRFAVPVVFLTAYSGDDILARAKHTEPFGYILKPFTERELCISLEMALYKHDVESKLHSTTRQLKALSRRILEVQEQERRRIAIELHDELGQALTAIKINLQLSTRLTHTPLSDLNAENIRIVEDTLQQVRRLATTLRPSLLDDLGLAPALKWMAEQSASRNGFEVNFHHVRAQGRLAPDIETACFRIVQEALTNIARHAQAKHVEISLGCVDNELVLRVLDDGTGFDHSAMQERALAGDSLGVLGMQERASLIGGQLSIQSAPEKGSIVQLICPWRTYEDAQ